MAKPRKPPAAPSAAPPAPPAASASESSITSHSSLNSLPDSAFIKRNFSLFNVFVASTILKLLLFPAYYSTDFEVHRNWLAITRSLPINEWYTNHTSKWTLDYPPFFAYFEWFIGLFVPPAVAADGCLDVVEDGIVTWKTVYFQRCSVIISELILVFSLQYFINTSPSGATAEKIRNYAVAVSIFLSPGFLIIDHIHFQYNGMMYGILIFSITAVRNGRPLLAGVLFAVLLCFKHIYLYLAPAYFVYLLRVYCLNWDVLTEVCRRIVGGGRGTKGGEGRESGRGNASSGGSAAVRGLVSATGQARGSDSSKGDSGGSASATASATSPSPSPSSATGILNLGNCLRLGCALLLIFSAAFGPFVYFGQTSQLLSRLFPFSRGLIHAYWAPNVWAQYTFIDKLLSVALPKLRLGGLLGSAVNSVNSVDSVTFSAFAPATEGVNANGTAEYLAAAAAGTRGIVGDVRFAVLRAVSPRTCFLLTVFYQILALVPLFLQPTYPRFVAAVTLCGFASFLFGWHVHEKAVLLMIVPYSLIAGMDRRLLWSTFVPLTVAGIVSLFPLVITRRETGLVVLYSLVWFLLSFGSLQETVRPSSSVLRRVFLFDRVLAVYLLGFLPLVLGWMFGVLPMLSGGTVFERYQFVGLMAFSVYCSLGVVSSWFGVSWLYFFDEDLWKEE